MRSSPKVSLVSFADGAFAARRPRFIFEAQSLNVFDEVACLDASQLPVAFVEQHLSYLRTQKRGYGYWIWKPQVIGLALEQATEGDLVVYLDAGFTLNPGGRARLVEYFEIAFASPFGALSFQNTHTECLWTKADLAIRLGVLDASDVMKTSQLSSGFMVFRKTQSNVDLVKEWQRIAVEENYRYSDDTPSVHENHAGFREHRHDQSISSLLRKIRGTTITHYEVQQYDGYFEALKSSLPAWATRLRY